MHFTYLLTYIFTNAFRHIYIYFNAYTCANINGTTSNVSCVWNSAWSQGKFFSNEFDNNQLGPTVRMSNIFNKLASDIMCQNFNFILTMLMQHNLNKRNLCQSNVNSIFFAYIPHVQFSNLYTIYKNNTIQ